MTAVVRRSRRDLLHRVDAPHPRSDVLAGQLLDGLGEQVDELSFSVHSDLAQCHHGAQRDTAQRHQRRQSLQQGHPHVVDGFEPVAGRKARRSAAKIVLDKPGGKKEDACDNQDTHNDHAQSHHNRTSNHPVGHDATPSRSTVEPEDSGT
ncbi:hypothetical protein Mco01_53260 [Microbispora corallina]|uniref:Transposase n=1 Tax=Microbispora corallina TaxID=83302 RepID=A0ABQ4G5G9_9ACTN|nr:hypothetical protein [Microbispora corallina]GIH42326.1 hypothetical protein Mco01_53260 [Microbispora corallina]